MVHSPSSLRIFSYVPNPRVWKATIAARLTGVNLEVLGASATDLTGWLWDFDAHALTCDDREQMRGTQRQARRGLANGMFYKTDGFMDAHPFGNVPAASSPDGTTGVFEFNSILRLVARLSDGPVKLLGKGIFENSKVDSFLDASLVFSHDLQRYILGLRSGQIDAKLHTAAEVALDSYLTGIDHTLMFNGRYLVGDEITIADICFVCDLVVLSNEKPYQDALSMENLESIARPDLASRYPRAFEHFFRLRRDPAFAPDFDSYQEKLSSAPFVATPKEVVLAGTIGEVE
jgi:elongation factor 1-gamma